MPLVANAHLSRRRPPDFTTKPGAAAGFDRAFWRAKATSRDHQLVGFRRNSNRCGLGRSPYAYDTRPDSAAPFFGGKTARLRLCGDGGCGARFGFAAALPGPGQDFGDAFGGMVGKPGEDVGEPGARIDVVELAGLCRAPNYAEGCRG